MNCDSIDPQKDSEIEVEMGDHNNDAQTSSLDEIKVAWKEGAAMRADQRRNCCSQPQIKTLENKEKSLWLRLLKLGHEGPQFYRNMLEEYEYTGSVELPNHDNQVIDLSDETTDNLLPSPVNHQ